MSSSGPMWKAPNGINNIPYGSVCKNGALKVPTSSPVEPDPQPVENITRKIKTKP